MPFSLHMPAVLPSMPRPCLCKHPFQQPILGCYAMPILRDCMFSVRKVSVCLAGTVGAQFPRAKEESLRVTGPSSTPADGEQQSFYEPMNNT